MNQFNNEQPSSLQPSTNPAIISNPYKQFQPLREFPARALLPLGSGYLWQIQSGAARTMTWLEDGTVVTLGIWGPGDIVGQALSRITPYQIECLTRLEATMYPLDVDPQQLINLLFLYTQQSEEMAVVRGHRRVDAMLYHFFELLSKKFGHHVETGQLIDLRLTHQDIADSLGTTRVTITRLMKQFQEQGIIERRSISQFIFREEERFWHYEI